MTTLQKRETGPNFTSFAFLLPPGMFPSLAVSSEWVAWLQLQGGQGKEIAQLPPAHPPGAASLRMPLAKAALLGRADLLWRLEKAKPLFCFELSDEFWLETNPSPG